MSTQLTAPKAYRELARPFDPNRPELCQRSNTWPPAPPTPEEIQQLFNVPVPAASDRDSLSFAGRTNHR